VTIVAVDPVGAALVASLARPGGNVTGLTNDTGPELGAKLLQLLKEAVPSTTRVVVLRDSSVQPGYARYAAAMEAASSSMHVALHWVEVRGPADLDRAFGAALRDRPDALVVGVQALSITHGRTIAGFATRNRLATIARNRELVEVGGLMAYSTDLLDLYRRAAIHIDKILKGTKPADLPMEEPTKFELTINLRTAKALSLAIPQSILVRAERVIE
jgi:putative ABC transport system substrate-binding protein